MSSSSLLRKLHIAAEAIIALAGTAYARPVLVDADQEPTNPLEAGRELFETPDSQVMPHGTPNVGALENHPLEARKALFGAHNSQVMPVTPEGTREAANLLHSLSNRNQLWSKHNPNRKLVKVALPNGYVATIPSLYDIKSKKKIKEWKRCEATVRNIEKVLNAGKYNGTYLGKRLLAAGMAHAPAMTQSTAEMVIPCIVGSFLADAGLKVDPSKIAAASPGKATLSKNAVSRLSTTCARNLKLSNGYIWPATRQTRTTTIILLRYSAGGTRKWQRLRR
jgi:hypothetical protein